ncbi:MAG: hypothetical protein Q4P15_04475 [Propionibacteriaceae bacterium]|nr:hypothetical protein [Propionibacteriaceae bacterium]
MISQGVADLVRRPAPGHLAVLPGCTPVVFRGDQPHARVATIGINPSIREFLTRGDEELAGPQRRFETLSSLGIASLSEATDDMVDQVVQRCLDYFVSNPYRVWFDPMESLVNELFGASYFGSTCCHLDVVQWATRPLWGNLDPSVRSQLVAGGVEFVRPQLSHDSLDAVYLNGRTVCEALATIIPLSARTARFRDTGPPRGFFRGLYDGVAVVGCSANLQVERVRAEDRAAFTAWVIGECRRDLAAIDVGS